MIFKDLADLAEDDRIRQIGTAAMTHKMTGAFVVEAEGGKADRYIKKLKERFPGIRVIERCAGPLDGMETVKVGPPLQ